MSEPYHRYVFDADHRRFVGAFDEMYRAAGEEGFDPWHQDTFGLRQRLTLAMLPGPFESIVDIGCGNGALTAALAKRADRALGLDVSPTAVATAARRFPGVEFRVATGDVRQDLRGESFALGCAIEVISYLEGWRKLIAELAHHAQQIFVSVYLPPDPIGYVKTFDELRDAFGRVAEIDDDVFAATLGVLLLRGRTR